MDAMVEEQPNQVPEEVQVPETDDEVLSRLDGALKGAMMLEKPRVSKKVMVGALRGQNKVLQKLVRDTDEQRTRVRFLTDKTNFMRESIDYLEKKTENQERIILKQQEKIEDLTTIVEQFKSRVESLDRVLAKMKEMEGTFAIVAESATRQAAFNDRMEATVEETKTFRQNTVVRLDNLDRELKNLPSTIVINSDQVLLDKPASLKHGVRQLTVRDVVKELKSTVEQHDVDISALKKDCRRYEEELQGKASIEVAAKVEHQMQLMDHMKQRLDVQDAVDLLDVRRNLNTCLESIDEVRLDLMMKINAADVDEKIEERYEDIVDHLMKALKNVQDDEDDFRKATEDLHAALDSIRGDKADKGELEFVKERIQKISEESARPDPELLDSIQKRLTKEEVEEMIEDKVDKDELTRAIEDLTKTLSQYASRLRKMRPGEGDQRLLGGLAKTLKICNMDPGALGTPGSGNAIVVTEGIGRHRPHGPLPFKICLSCHSQLPNAPKEKIISGAAYGGGFQLFLPGSAKGPPLRTGTPASPEQVTFSEQLQLSPNKKDARKQRGSESSPAPKTNSPRISDVVSF